MKRFIGVLIGLESRDISVSKKHRDKIAGEIDKKTQHKKQRLGNQT